MQLIDRLKRLEERRSPLMRSYDLVARGVPVEQWPTAELEAFVSAECADMRDLSDAELEALASSEV